MTEGDKILQIMPADGWYARYEDEDGEEDLVKLVCFALIETEDEGQAFRVVRPMSSGDDGMIDYADAADTFAGLVHDAGGGPSGDES